MKRNARILFQANHPHVQSDYKGQYDTESAAVRKAFLNYWVSRHGPSICLERIRKDGRRLMMSKSLGVDSVEPYCTLGNANIIEFASAVSSAEVLPLCSSTFDGADGDRSFCAIFQVREIRTE